MFRRLSSRVARQFSSQPRPLTLYVNGAKKTLTQFDNDAFLIEYLHAQGLTGTKLACGEGGCGACTVTLSAYDELAGRVRHRALNSCMVNLGTCDGVHVTTVEGLGGAHGVQRRMAESFGSQCGYCTPGFVMALYSKLADAAEAHALPVDEHALEKAIDGNLCRCTGYRPIADAVAALAAATQTPADARAPRLTDDMLAQQRAKSDELDTCGFYAPNSLEALLQRLSSSSSAPRLVVGNTELGIEQRFKGVQSPLVIGLHHVGELRAFSVADDGSGVRIGAALDLETLRERLAPLVTRDDADAAADASGALRAVYEQLQWFSGTSVRSGASLGGNIATASPISDLNPVWLAVNARFELARWDAATSRVARRHVDAQDFFEVAYRRTALARDEVIVAVHVPTTTTTTPKRRCVRAFKQAQRREDDIAIVTACMLVDFEPRARRVAQLRLAYGGVAPFVRRAARAEALAVGRVWDASLEADVRAALLDELALPADVPGGRAAYRRVLGASLWRKFFYAATAHVLGAAAVPTRERNDLRHAAANTSALAARACVRGVQTFGDEPDAAVAPVGEPVTHVNAARQAAGAAMYVTDMPPQARERAAALVLSERARARIVRIDASAALALDGVHAFYDARDVPGSNVLGDIVRDELVFAEQRVQCVGQALGVLVADTERLAWRAARLVRVEYSDEPDGAPPTLSIEAADAAGDYIPYVEGALEHKVVRGGTDDDVLRAIDAAPVVVEGRVRIGGQEHFYFEPMATLVVPEEGGAELAVYASSQNLNKTQEAVASVLGMPMHRVAASARRIGGGFGGKETQNIAFAAAAAVAAHHQRRPVRMVLPRDVDMLATGKRHAFVGTYRAGFERDGRVVGADVRLVNNAGHSYDLSGPVLDRALLHSVNAYNVPYFRVCGQMARTNKFSNTAFRGFGGPQGMIVAETWLEHAAHALGAPVDRVRRVNLARRSDRTHYGQQFNVDLPRLWRQAAALGDVKRARRDVAAFNRKHRHHKRGVAFVPACFGLAFTFTPLNQGSALVHIYADGSVVVSIGGIEMGQGLFTKVAQVVAAELRVPLDAVHLKDTSTEKIANASATAASMGSDLYCMAAKRACETLRRRLAPFARDGAAWRDVVQAAWAARVSLSEHAFYAPPVSGYDFATGAGTPFSYYTSGAAVCVAEIDTLTGDHRLLRTDIVMDVGRSINPSIDIGQIEGAFVQGYGWLMLEDLVFGGEREHVWLPPGRLATPGPGTYKLPSMDDTPRVFNVHLTRKTGNARAVHRSRGIGEPPILLSTSAMFAVRNAIAAARADAGVDTWTDVDTPLSAERIRLSCVDDIQTDPDGYKGVVTSY